MGAHPAIVQPFPEKAVDENGLGQVSWLAARAYSPPLPGVFIPSGLPCGFRRRLQLLDSEGFAPSSLTPGPVGKNDILQRGESTPTMASGQGDSGNRDQGCGTGEPCRHLLKPVDTIAPDTECASVGYQRLEARTSPVSVRISRRRLNVNFAR